MYNPFSTGSTSDSPTQAEHTPGTSRGVATFLRRVLRGEDGASATVQTLVAQALVIAANVVTGIITARALGPNGRGALEAMKVGPVFAASLLMLGLPSALTFTFRRYPGRQSNLLAAALVLGASLSALAAGAGALLLPRWIGQYSPPVVRFAQVLMLSAPLHTLVSITRAALEAQDRFTQSNALSVAIHWGTLALLIGLLATGSLTPMRAAVAYVVTAIAVAWPLWRLFRRLRPRLERLRWALARLTSYSVRSGGVQILGALSVHIDKVLVVGLIAPEAMGLYVVALSAARLLEVVQKATRRVLLPKSASRPVPEVIALTGRAARFNLVLTLTGGAVLAAFAPALLSLVYGPAFADGTLLLRLLVAEVLLSSTAMVLAQAFMALDRPGVVTVLQGLSVGLNVPLMLLFVPPLGIAGAGLSLLVASAVRLGAILACYPLLLGVAPPPFLPTQRDARVLQAFLRSF